MDADATKMLFKLYRKDFKDLEDRVERLLSKCTHKYDNGSSSIDDDGRCLACERTVKK